MKKILIILSALALHGGEECPAMDRFAALSMIESGDNDNAIGVGGEVSRYQILPGVWRGTTLPLAVATNAPVARQVALAIMDQRARNFEFHHHRAPDDFEFYKLWNPRCPDETARRFANLCARQP